MEASMNGSFGNGTSVTSCKLSSLLVPSITFTVCVLGNLLAIIFLYRSNEISNKKQHAFYTLVMTLACCDLSSALLTTPVTFAVYITGNCITELGTFRLCAYSGYMMIFFGITSMAVVFVMTLERFLAVRYPIFYQTRITSSTTRHILGGIVLSCAVWSALPLFGFGKIAQQYPGSWCFTDWKSTTLVPQIFNFFFAFVGILLLIATIVCNVIVVITVSRSRRRMKRQNSSHKVMDKKRKKKKSQQENQMIFLMGVMTTVFTLCYLPLLCRVMVNQITAITDPERAFAMPLEKWDLFAVRMAAINPLIDPWIYILFRRETMSRIFKFLKITSTCEWRRLQDVFSDDSSCNRIHNNMANFLWSILWLLALLFIGWPVGFLVSGLYVLFLPFTVCIKPCNDVAEFLLKGVQLPLHFAQNMANATPMC